MVLSNSDMQSRQLWLAPEVWGPMQLPAASTPCRLLLASGEHFSGSLDRDPDLIEGAAVNGSGITPAASSGTAAAAGSGTAAAADSGTAAAAAATESTPGDTTTDPSGTSSMTPAAASRAPSGALTAVWPELRAALQLEAGDHLLVHADLSRQPPQLLLSAKRTGRAAREQREAAAAALQQQQEELERERLAQERLERRRHTPLPRGQLAAAFHVGNLMTRDTPLHLKQSHSSLVPSNGHGVHLMHIKWHLTHHC